jgi:hypothetical protein
MIDIQNHTDGKLKDQPTNQSLDLKNSKLGTTRLVQAFDRQVASPRHLRVIPGQLPLTNCELPITNSVPHEHSRTRTNTHERQLRSSRSRGERDRG